MGYVLGRKPEHETLCFFRVKWLQATMKGTLVCATVAAAVGLSFFFLPQCNGGLKLLWVCFWCA